MKLRRAYILGLPISSGIPNVLEEPELVGEGGAIIQARHDGRVIHVPRAACVCVYDAPKPQATVAPSETPIASDSDTRRRRKREARTKGPLRDASP